MTNFVTGKILIIYEILTRNTFFFFDNGYAGIYLHYFFLFVSKILALYSHDVKIRRYRVIITV